MDHCPIWTAAAKGQYPDWNEFLTGYGSTVDWPSAALWKEMSEALPEAIVVLSIRDAQAWWESAHSTIFQAIPHHPDPVWQEMIQTLFALKTQMKMDDEKSCIEAFNAHNEEVIKTISPERLVVWNAADGWEPLCKALNVPIPNEPFPKSNTREEFLQHVRERQSEKPA